MAPQTVNFDKNCPACGEDGELYHYFGGNPEEPSPAEGYCDLCMWNFTETAQHYPPLVDVEKHRSEYIHSLIKELNRVKKWQP